MRSFKERLRRLGLGRLYRRGRRLAGALARASRRLRQRSFRLAAGVARWLVLGARGVVRRHLHLLARTRLAVERRRSSTAAGKRLLAVGCWSFPVYSQTFVYQELSELIRQGFDLRLVYARLGSKNQLAPRFEPLWRRRRRLIVDSGAQATDFRYFMRRRPRRVEALLQRLGESCDLTPSQILHHQDVRRAFSFARLAAAYRPRYLHSYFFYEGTLFALVASWLLDVPRGVSCYADHLLDDYELKLVPLHLATCELVVATSDRIRRELLAIDPDAEERIVVKPNAIDVRHFPPRRRPAPASGEPFRLLCVNRIEPKKGLLGAVEAVHRLRRGGLEAELHIVGESDPESPASESCARELKARIDRLGLGGAVHLEGRQDESGVRRHLARAHLFLAPYVEAPDGDKDGIPTALLEAMSTGLPAVATDAGSISEVIDDGVDGILVGQRDPEQLAAAAASLLLDPERRDRLGESAAAKVAARFDVEACEPTFHNRLRQILGRPNGKGLVDPPGGGC